MGRPPPKIIGAILERILSEPHDIRRLRQYYYVFTAMTTTYASFELLFSMLAILSRFHSNSPAIRMNSSELPPRVDTVPVHVGSIRTIPIQVEPFLF